MFVPSGVRFGDVQSTGVKTTRFAILPRLPGLLMHTGTHQYIWEKTGTCEYAIPYFYLDYLKKNHRLPVPMDF